VFAPNWYDSDHQRLKSRYPRYMFVASLAAIVLTGLGAVFSPPYIPTPYQLRERTVVSVELPDDFVVPPPPADIERPEIARAFEASDDADATETIAPTDFNPFEPPEIPQAPAAPEDFVAYDSAPEVIHLEPAAFPEMAMQAESEGTVEVVITIDENGRVINAYVSTSTATELLQQAALQAARKCLFKPAMQRDVPVKCQIVIPYTFSLN
jgi:protein TonB